MKPPPDPAIERVTLRGIGEGLREQLHLDRGLGYTIKLLVVRPRRAIEEFLFEDRRRMIRPFTLLFLSVGVATFLSLEFLFSADAVAEARAVGVDLPERLGRALVLSIAMIRNYFNLAYLLSLPPLTLASYMVFRAQRLNLAEHLVLNTFLFSIQTIAFILTVPVLVLGDGALAMVAVTLPAAYTVWFFKDVFELGWWGAVLRSAMVLLLGQALSVVLGGLIFGVLVLFVG